MLAEGDDNVPPRCATGYLGMVIFTTYVNTGAGVPSYARELGSKTKYLSRRQIWEIDRDLIVSDELVHSRATTPCLRTGLPRDDINIRAIYYRRDAQGRREEDSGASSDTDYENLPTMVQTSEDDAPRSSRKPCIPGNPLYNVQSHGHGGVTKKHKTKKRRDDTGPNWHQDRHLLTRQRRRKQSLLRTKKGP